MKKTDFNEIYKKYNNFNTFLDRLNFCIEVLKPSTCYKISKYTQIPIPTITRIKNGQIQKPNTAYVFAISEYFGVTYEWLQESKYFPITYKEYNEKCLSGGSSSEKELKDIESKNTKTKLDIDFNEYTQIIKAFPMFKSLIPQIIEYLSGNGLLNEALKNNESSINELLKDLNTKEKKTNTKNKSIQELGKKARFSSNNDIDKIREDYNSIKNNDSD